MATERTGAALSRREREVAALVAQGLTDKEIAARLCLSVRTVQCHVRNILGKLGLSSRRRLMIDGVPGDSARI